MHLTQCREVPAHGSARPLLALQVTPGPFTAISWAVP